MKGKDATIERLMREVESLNREIDATNQGLIAMHWELQERGTELEVARQQLAVSEKLAALGSLVSGVAHEVRTPLTIVATNLYMLDRHVSKAGLTGNFAPVAESMPVVMQEVLSAIARVQSLVKRLGRFTQVQSLTTRCLIDPIVREAIDLYAAVSCSQTRVESDLRAPPPVLVDRSQLQQIVINLVDNAVHASAHVLEPVVVRTYADAHGTGAVLEVEDHGVGMTAQTQARMFEPLFTTKPEGTGVGLTIVQRIAQEHRAEISCRSAPGTGTTFTVHFPARAAAEVAAPASPAEPPVVAPRA